MEKAADHQHGIFLPPVSGRCLSASNSCSHSHSAPWWFVPSNVSQNLSFIYSLNWHFNIFFIDMRNIAIREKWFWGLGLLFSLTWSWGSWVFRADLYEESGRVCDFMPKKSEKPEAELSGQFWWEFGAPECWDKCGQFMRFQKRTRILLGNCATDHSYYILPPPPDLPAFYLCPRNLNRDNCQRNGLNCFEGEILRSIMYSLYCGTVHCFRENQIFLKCAAWRGKKCE